MFRVALSSFRYKSTLAEKLRNSSLGSADKSKEVTLGLTGLKDENNEEFRELFVMPKRKLRGQLQLEHATGRTELKQRSRPDLNDRLSYRRPRNEEMTVNQEWSDVWPAPRTYSSSVVPLPIRMGTRPNVEKRAPFKKEGNLELVKIPNFLHLTPLAITKHTEAIKKFCTTFPVELKNNEKLYKSDFPVTVQYSTYVHQGTNIRDVRSRVVSMVINVDKLMLDEKMQEKLIRLCGDRYDTTSNTLTIITDRCHTRQQNLDYAYYLLTVLYHEARRPEQWEALKNKKDSLLVEYANSTFHQQLEVFCDKINKNNSPDMKVSYEESLKSLEKMWSKYRNTEETPATTREYGKQVKELLKLSLQNAP